ncbi:signal peptidase I [Nocardioides flavescens]|uniref:signal peptidase I n=1 Tax=Nocardioides flavescens TaxID=2691959 RepID=UPI00301E4BD1
MTTDDATASTEPRRRPERRHLPLWQESLVLLVVAVVLAVVLKTFFVQAFYIPSESMEPGLVKDDRILVQKVSHWRGSPQRGDVVVFEDPGGWLPTDEVPGPGNPVTEVLTRVGLMPSGGHLVKRVIGVAGDTIVCCDDNGDLQVNGVAIDESGYVRDDPDSPCNGPMPASKCNWTAGPVPVGHVFVMGDNRANSADSSQKLCLPDVTDCVPGREFVPDDLVVGKVFALVWPLSRFGGVTGAGSTFDEVPAGTS